MSLQAYSDFCSRTSCYRSDKTQEVQSSKFGPETSTHGITIRQIKRFSTYAGLLGTETVHYASLRSNECELKVVCRKIRRNN